MHPSFLAPLLPASCPSSLPSLRNSEGLICMNGCEIQASQVRPGSVVLLVHAFWLFAPISQWRVSSFADIGCQRGCRAVGRQYEVGQARSLGGSGYGCKDCKRPAFSRKLLLLGLSRSSGKGVQGLATTLCNTTPHPRFTSLEQGRRPT